MRRLLAPFGVAGWAGVAAAVAASALRVAVVPLFVGPVLDRVLVQGDMDVLPRVLATSGAALIGMSLLVLAQETMLASSGAALAARWRERLYRDLLRRDPGRLPGTSGGLAGRILADLVEVEHFHRYGIGTIVAEATAIAAILAVLFWRAPGPTLALLALGVPAAWVLAVLGRRLRAQADRAQAGSEAVTAHLQEGLRQHAVARAFGAEEFLIRRFDEANDATRRAAVRRGFLSALQIPASQIALFVALAGLVTLLAGQASTGRLSVGEVVEYLTLVALLTTPAQMLPRGYALLRQGEAAARRLRQLETAPASHVPSPDAARPEAPGRDDPPHDLAGAHAAEREAPAYLADAERGLHLDDVWVRHLDGPYVLRGATARLPERGLVALVGESGAGKSTLLAMLLGFLAAERGRATLAGRPLTAARDAIGWVPQSLDLMRGPLRDNLTLGRDARDEELREALRAVGMDEAVDELPTGLDHVLDEDGAGLSGGQRQRLAIARALLRRPAVLLLDEPTANLDAASEAALVRTLRREARHRLVLAVAHRTALADAADLVLRLEDGRLHPVDASSAEAAVPTAAGDPRSGRGGDAGGGPT